MTTDTEGLRARVRNVIRSQEQVTVTTLSSLLAVQDEFGYIPEEGIEEVAGFTGATINDVWGVASFYTNFRFNPPRRPYGRALLGLLLPRPGGHARDKGRSGRPRA